MRAVDLAKLADSGVRLAPPGMRLLAGTIDALPVLAAFVVQVNRFGTSRFGSEGDALSSWLFWGSLGVYVAHTLVSEMLTGRTIGKAVCGLRVVSLDGSTATPGQLVIRNLLRVIDVGLYFLPLLLIPFSPLRQRAADAAAGTMVVAKAWREAGDGAEAADKGEGKVEGGDDQNVRAGEGKDDGDTPR